MEVVFKRDDLATALQLLSAVIDRKVTIPILAGVLIEVTPTGAICTATNLDNTLWLNVPAVCQRPGAVVLVADRLSALIQRSSAGDVLLEAVKDTVKLSCGTSTAKLPTLPAEDYPRIAAAEPPTPTATLTAEALIDLVARVQHTLTDEYPQCKGGHLELTPAGVCLLASDGHRMALVNAAATVTEATTCTLSERAWTALAKWLKGETPAATVAMSLTEGRVWFTTDRGSFSCRPFDYVYPNVRRVIPRDPPHRVSVVPSVLVGALRRHLSLMTADKTGVTLRIADGSMHLRTKTPYGEADDDVPCADFTGDAIEFGVNARYLVDAVDALPVDEAVQIAIVNDSTPIALCAPHDPGRMTTLVQLMRI